MVILESMAYWYWYGANEIIKIQRDWNDDRLDDFRNETQRTLSLVVI
jgi:hypothetical protein